LPGASAASDRRIHLRADDQRDEPAEKIQRRGGMAGLFGFNRFSKVRIRSSRPFSVVAIISWPCSTWISGVPLAGSSLSPSMLRPAMATVQGRPDSHAAPWDELGWPADCPAAAGVSAFSSAPCSGRRTAGLLYGSGTSGRSGVSCVTLAAPPGAGQIEIQVTALRKLTSRSRSSRPELLRPRFSSFALAARKPGVRGSRPPLCGAARNQVRRPGKTIGRACRETGVARAASHAIAAARRAEDIE